MSSWFETWSRNTWQFVTCWCCASPRDASKGGASQGPVPVSDEATLATSSQQRVEQLENELKRERAVIDSLNVRMNVMNVRFRQTQDIMQMTEVARANDDTAAKEADGQLEEMQRKLDTMSKELERVKRKAGRKGATKKPSF